MATQRSRATTTRKSTTSKAAARKPAAKKPRRRAPGAVVTLNGRFPAGTRVALVEVDSEQVLRSAGGKTIARKKVDDQGQVQFTSGVKKGARYFITGYINGVFTEVRASGRAPSDDNAVLAQPPVQPDVTTTGIGRQPVPADSEPHGLRLAQEQVGDQVPQRSSTETGTAHPVDPAEVGPYPDQASDDFSSGKFAQRSDTPVGQATPIVEHPVRQEDVPSSVPQRSNTPTGVATPLPAGDAVQAVKGIESGVAKAALGEPAQAEIRGGRSALSSGGDVHEDRYKERYRPVGPGVDPTEGRPEGRGLRKSEKSSRRRKR